MLLRRVARGNEPDASGDEANHSAGPERSSPPVVNQEVGDERGRKTSPNSHTGENPSIGKSALLFRHPARDKLVRGRKHHGLTRAEQKTHGDKPQQRRLNSRRNHGRERGENS